MSIVLLVTFAVLLLLDIPVVFCMLISALAALFYSGTDPIMVGLEMSRAMGAFYPFLAVPFFILAGDVMNYGGLSQKITEFCTALTGHRRGGMAMVTTLSSQMVGAISGSSSATCAAVGGVMIPIMEKQGYSRPFATALSACSGTTGALIPPSMMLLIYGVIADVSIEKMFLAGVFPGILMGLALMTSSFFYARKTQVPINKKAGIKKLFRTAYASLAAMILVLIIFVGILGGIFTATEAAAVAVVYAVLVGFLIYRKLKISDLPRILVGAGKTASVLSFLLCAALLFSWVLALGKVPETVAGGLIEGCEGLLCAISSDWDPDLFFLAKKLLILAAINLALLLIGMFLDGGAALFIVVPVLMPIGKEIGMDPIHFGVIIVCNLIIGLVTPPIGTTLFVASGVGKVSMESMIPHVLRFLGLMLLVQLIVTYIPPISTFFPKLIQ